VGAPLRIPFWIDESLPLQDILLILANHSVQQVTIKAMDQEILRSAEDQGAIVIVQDKWFLKQLYRLPRHDRRCLRKAGVIQLPGEWDKAEIRLRKYLPLIELAYQICMLQPDDRRLGINLATTEIRIFDPWDLPEPADEDQPQE
jgi:hypothetical protein